MKRQKYYIPLVVSKNGSLTHTMVSANKIQELFELIPSHEDIVGHLLAQKQMMAKDKKEYTTIKIFVTQADFDKYIKILAQKIGNSDFDKSCINICLDSNTIPLVQVVVKTKDNEKVYQQEVSNTEE